MEENSSFQMVHPNWKALATIHIPYKRFVTPGQSTEPQKSLIKKPQTIPETIISGPEVKEFYETVTQTSFPKYKQKNEAKQITKNIKTPSIDKLIPFDRNKFFNAAMSNDINTLKSFQYTNDDLNSTDMFGWTALMMAACEGSTETFRFLLENGANLNLKDNKGLTASMLAKKKGFHKILDIIINFKNTKRSAIETFTKSNEINEIFYCDICENEFKETTRRKHQTSTVHQFNMKHEKKKSLRYSISRQNRGLKIMVKQGWNEESGLGPTGNGHLFPIKTVIRKQKTGLGIPQNSAKVTHFKPYDLDAIKYHPPLRTKTRKDMQKEKRRNQKQDRRLRKELS